MEPELLEAIKNISHIKATVDGMSEAFKEHLKVDEKRDEETKERLSGYSKRVASLEKSRAWMAGAVTGVNVAVVAAYHYFTKGTS